MFQSTHPRGVRLHSRPDMSGMFHVSIHAPTWGATARQNDLARGDVFQSTHPRGVRQRADVNKEHLKRFNPRTHVGCDTAIWLVALGLLMFQSTHPRGVRPFVDGKYQPSIGVSIHAPTWGATYPDFHSTFILYVSIHAPTWGATFS